MVFMYNYSVDQTLIRGFFLRIKISNSGLSIIELLMAVGLLSMSVLFFNDVQKEISEETTALKADSQAVSVFNESFNYLRQVPVCESYFKGLTLEPNETYFDESGDDDFSVISTDGKDEYGEEKGYPVLKEGEYLDDNNTLLVKELSIRTDERKAFFVLELERMRGAGLKLIKREFALNIYKNNENLVTSCFDANLNIELTVKSKACQGFDGLSYNKETGECTAKIRPPSGGPCGEVAVDFKYDPATHSYKMDTENPYGVNSLDPCDDSIYGPDGDLDGDGIPNKDDPDIDGDGYPNASDIAPYDASRPKAGDFDGDGTPDSEDDDDDGDGVPDGEDTDPNDPNIPESQPDFDGDGIPDKTDPDDDNDGYPDETDPDDFNPDIPGPDTDGDGVPDSEDPDDDNDGVPDEEDPDPTNPDIPEPDSDGDGVPDGSDNCPDTAGPNNGCPCDECEFSNGIDANGCAQCVQATQCNLNGAFSSVSLEQCPEAAVVIVNDENGYECSYCSCPVVEEGCPNIQVGDNGCQYCVYESCPEGQDPCPCNNNTCTSEMGFEEKDGFLGFFCNEVEPIIDCKTRWVDVEIIDLQIPIGETEIEVSAKPGANHGDDNHTICACDAEDKTKKTCPKIQEIEIEREANSCGTKCNDPEIEIAPEGSVQWIEEEITIPNGDCESETTTDVLTDCDCTGRSDIIECKTWNVFSVTKATSECGDSCSLPESKSYDEDWNSITETEVNSGNFFVDVIDYDCDCGAAAGEDSGCPEIIIEDPEQLCGRPGQACCEGETSCEEGTVCLPGNICIACGGLGQPCCGEEGSYSCSTETGFCNETAEIPSCCGGEGEPPCICEGDNCGCQEGTITNENGECESCGDDNQICCSEEAGACNEEGSQCLESNTCGPCGSDGQAPCPESGCDEGIQVVPAIGGEKSQSG